MFKFAGSKKQAELQAHVDHKNLSFKVSVVTGPSGSYKEEDMIAFLEKWLEPWGPRREWGFFSWMLMPHALLMMCSDCVGVGVTYP